MTTLLPGLALGGVVIATLGGISEFVREKHLPSPKGVVRDFLIGAIMVAFLYQIIPESMNDLMGSFSGLRLPALAGLSLLKGGGETPSAGGGSGGFDPDLQIGMPRF
jgi:hypothetical protein